MVKKPTTTTEPEVPTHHYIRVAAYMVFGISLMAFLIFEAYPYLTIKRATAPADVVEQEGAASNTPAFSLTRSEPVRLRIPTLNIDTTFESALGLNEDRSIEVPKSYEQVGWYQYGAAPGEIGPAVVLGHVDSYEGAAIFYHLGKLASGDRVFITRADGTEAEFEVQYLERYPQSDFPTEKVYGKTSDAELRLITCTGKYEKGIQRYTHNLVVYARLVEPEATIQEK